ncbi:hypothetical protein OUZ56_003185 [Daphnia magna]|uniref:Uncharacterized protein n=1 Tax=Daphnia magna TaxID=35525 RepID=A0ABR0A803_9CRUS|nr:hypothetical protein OUZ56_003185 [Daphnia magna]
MTATLPYYVNECLRCGNTVTDTGLLMKSTNSTGDEQGDLLGRGVNCPCSGACPDVGATILTRRVELGSQGAPINNMKLLQDHLSFLFSLLTIKLEETEFLRVTDGYGKQRKFFHGKRLHLGFQDTDDYSVYQ